LTYRNVPEVRILGKPLVSVVAFASDVVNILEVGDRLNKKGWHRALFVSCCHAPHSSTVNALQDPPALHIAVTRLTVPRVDDFIQDVKDSVRDVLLDPTSSKGTMTTVYGLGNSSPVGPGLVKEVACMFIDTLCVYVSRPPTY
jgi:sphinganine-1-phosphate aldolase